MRHGVARRGRQRTRRPAGGCPGRGARIDDGTLCVVRLLLSAYRAAFLKNYATVVRELADRGHAVEILVEEPWRHIRGQDDVVRSLQGYRSLVTITDAPLRSRERWRGLAVELRSARDHLEFLDPSYAGRYRLRSVKRAPRLIRWAAKLGLARSRAARRALTHVLERLEAAIPPSPELVGLLRDRAPDALLLTPFVFLRNPQPDLLRAAQAVGIRSGVAVYSWDNLSSKSIVRPAPDRLFVWNETQKAEAVVRHGLAPATIEVTGAQCHDELFDAVPRAYGDFCERVGLDPTRPFILYACCAPWTFASEVEFVGRWLDHVRAADGPLAEAGVLIRPHPKRPETWATDDVSRWPNVAVWPREAELPTGGDAWADYLDSLAHCSTLVGINTSLMIEGAARGKPILTVLEDEFAEVQGDTLHFRYLLDEERGPLTVAHSLDEHVAQLEAVMVDPAAAAARARAFAFSFFRPWGSTERATVHFADAVERLAALPPPKRRRATADAPLRAALAAGMGVYDGLRWTWRALRRRPLTTTD